MAVAITTTLPEETKAPPNETAAPAGPASPTLPTATATPGATATASPAATGDAPPPIAGIGQTWIRPTLSTFRVADFLVDTLLLAPGHGDIISINPVVGETNDGWLSDIRARPVEARHVRAALRSASRGPVEEGAVGAGTGTIALGWKGGIGTASRRLPVDLGGWTVGVLVQTNFGGSLVVDGHPVGRVMRERGISGLHDPSRNPSAARPGASARRGRGRLGS